ncbi:MAG: SDR family oxidoreductase [Anaerolineales bacterium]
MKNQTFLENVIIITGASFGIGRHLALQLAEQGAWLALAARNALKLEEVSKQCHQRGGKVVVIPTDVAEQSQCQNLIEGTVANYGRIDTLINNAGFGVASRFDELQDLSLFEKVIQVNFFGSVYCTHYALPYLKETRGRLVGVSSLRGKFPSATADGYGASKHAMAGFFDSLRNELADSGVSVTMIYPGWVSTGISSRALRADGKPTGKISVHEEGAMPVDDCARQIVQAVAMRKREVVMTLQGKLGLWIRLIAPGVVDRTTREKTG